MFLIKLDEDNRVVQTLALVALAELPLNTTLADYIISPIPAAVGQEYDPVTHQFLVPARRRWVTKLAFDNRFTMAEAVKLKLAQTYPTRLAEETDVEYAARCALPAQLQVMSGRLAMATYIDLEREDTVYGVTSLEQLGLLSAGRASAILTGEILAHEYHPDA